MTAGLPLFKRSQPLVELARSSARTKASTSFANSPNSPNSPAVISAEATALAIAAIVPAASPALCKAGSLKLTGRSRRGGKIRSRHSRIAVLSPASAISTTFRVSASASPSSSASAASVVRWRAPLGLPPGFPERPFENGRPRCIPAVFAAIVLSPIPRDSV